MRQIITWLYGTTGVLLLCAYVPQLVVLLRSQGRAESISALTWLLWATVSAITALYAGVVARDLLLTLFAAASSAAELLVVAVVLWKRRRP